MRRLTMVEARRIAVRAQLLDVKRPTELVSMVERLTLLQLDPTSVVSPSADLVAWSRLGPDYRPGDLRRELEVERTLFEHRQREDPSSGNIAVVRPMSAIGLHLAEMYALRDTPGPVLDWLQANAGFRQRVLDQLRTDGPVSSKEIPDTVDVPWKSTGWTGGRNVTQLLEFLASRGFVAIAGRTGKQRLWDLAERVYPADVEIVPIEEAARLRNEARLRALGVARPKFVGDAGEPVEVEGTSRPWRLDPDASAEDFVGRTAMLSPFDRLVHARDRTLDLFRFEYLIELYKPKAERVRGYYALPVLHHDELVGSIDLGVDQEKSVLVAHQVERDRPWTGKMTAAVDGELDQLRNWLGVDRVRLP